MHFGMNGNCLHNHRAHVFWHMSTGLVLTCKMFFVTYDRIAGNGASEKNLKDGVCAQFEKNFAKAKWRVCIHSYCLSIVVNKCCDKIA